MCVVNNLKERYTVQFPWVLARGLILGNQCIELYEKMKIKCEQTGLCAVVDFNVRIVKVIVLESLCVCVVLCICAKCVCMEV